MWRDWAGEIKLTLPFVISMLLHFINTYKVCLINYCHGQAHTRLLALSMFNVSMILILSNDDKRQIKYLETCTLCLNLWPWLWYQITQSFFKLLFDKMSKLGSRATFLVMFYLDFSNQDFSILPGSIENWALELFMLLSLACEVLGFQLSISWYCVS